MRQLLHRILFLAAVLVFIIINIPINAAPPSVTTTPNLPQGFAAFIPKDYKVDSCQTTTGKNLAGVSFVANKPDPQHSAINHEYRLNLDMNVTMSQLIKMREPIYRSQLEKDIESKRQSYAAAKSDPTIRFDPATVTKYPWGYGISQRRAHHYVGEGTGPDVVEYMCEYLGLIIDNTSVKQFELLVGGAESRDEADQWAKNVAVKIGKTTLANFRQ